MRDWTRLHEEEKSPAAPLWTVTFADMMGLLLCFFIMLVAISEVKAEKFRRTLESIKGAFGSAAAPSTNGPAKGNSLEEYISALASWRGAPENMGGAETARMRGSECLVKTVGEGLMITFGAEAPFERGSAVLNNELKKELSDLAYHVKGYTNVIIVRGHCSSDEVDIAGTDPWALGFARARAAADCLTGQGISQKRLIIESAGSAQPLDSNLTVGGQGANRRVEVIVARQTAGAERY
jgi:chemotaxis protein MotB